MKTGNSCSQKENKKFGCRCLIWKKVYIFLQIRFLCTQDDKHLVLINENVYNSCRYLACKPFGIENRALASIFSNRKYPWINSLSEDIIWNNLSYLLLFFLSFSFDSLYSKKFVNMLGSIYKDFDFFQDLFRTTEMITSSITWMNKYE